jgi:putative ATP-binding cassette transporter
MGLFTLFARQAPNKLFLSILLGALAGMSYALLIPIVLASLGHQDAAGDPDVQGAGTVLSLQVSNWRFALLFAGVCLFILLTRSLSQVLLSRLTLDATTELRVRTYRAIMSAPITQLEKIGPAKLMAAITSDVQRIIMGATIAPVVLISAVTLTGMLVYVYVLSPEIFWFVLGALLFGVVTYQVPMLAGRRYFERGRARVDALYESIRGLLHGTKELKLNRVKRERYFREILLDDEYAVLRNSKRGGTIITAAANYGDLLSFLVIGVVAFVFVNYHAVSADHLIGAVMVLLYITGPVGSLLNSIPQIAVASVSLRTVNGLFAQLTPENAGGGVCAAGTWSKVRLCGLGFQYGQPGGSFELGPVSLEIVKGEITFIVGGNGSGKSTLGKLISLHYLPTRGEIHFGEQQVTSESLDSCRQSVCAIFSDYFLFDRLLDSFEKQDPSMVSRYLEDLGLAGKLSIHDGRFSTTALSDGQRRRMALLVTLLEDRELYVFDEWAADQDPVFKDVFYHTVLPALRARDKAVVVISHDDRYFDVADQLAVMEDGKLIRVERPTARKIQLLDSHAVGSR